MSIALYNFVRAARKTRRTFSSVFKIMLGFIIFTILLIDHALASYFEYIGWWAPEWFVAYRFVWELVIGFIGFYIFFDILIKRIKWNYLSKFLALLLAVMVGEAFLFYFLQNPALFNDINFFRLLGQFIDTHPPLFAVYGGGKVFALVGITIFCVYLCYIVLKNKFYSTRSKILLSIGSLAFIDVIFGIPIIVSVGEKLNLAYALWCVFYTFIILANLTRINFKAISGIHEILISYKDGRPLYITGSETLEASMVTGMLSAISCISKEILDSKKRLRSIDHQDKKILFSYGEYIITSVITDEESQLLFSKVDLLTHEFENRFSGILYRWNGELGPFASAWFIIDKIFPITEWEHKKSVAEFTDNLMRKIKIGENQANKESE
jgi:hypothetical protein